MTIASVEMNERDKRVKEGGDEGQGEYLVNAKLRKKNSK